MIDLQFFLENCFKRCSCCGHLKLAVPGKFARQSSNASGLASWCCECINNASKARRNNSADINADKLHELLDYNPLTGEFIWKVTVSKNVKAGQVAGGIGDRGYQRIVIDGRPHLAHRLAYLWMTGEWPSNDIDHRDRNASNNRWENLRVATNGQNKANSIAGSNNKLGVKGVRLCKNKFRAQIQCNGKFKNLGSFSALDEAAAAYRAAAMAAYGEFARF